MKHLFRLVLFAFGVLVVDAAGLAHGARAQDGCDGSLLRAPIDVTPAVSATGVTLGAPIKVRYPTGYFEDLVIGADPLSSILVRESDTMMPVAGAISVIADVLIFIPDTELRARTRYEGTAFGFDADFDFRFTTGAVFDAGPPVLDALTSMTSTKIEVPSCDAPDGGYRIDVAFPAATDDGPPGDIEYFLFLTRGPGVDAPQLRKRARNQTPGEAIMAFVLDPAEATGPICVSVVAIDGVGNVAGGDDIVCDDPVDGSFFEPCSVSAARTGASGWLAIGLFSALGVVIGTRRARKRQRSSAAERTRRR